MKKVDCIFCGKNRSKANEHVWPKWLQLKLYGTLKEGFLSVNAQYLPRNEPDYRHTSGNSLVYGKVCAVCNNGWMSDLEGDFKRFYERIVSSEGLLVKNISKQERSIISLWALKTSMMINSSGNYRQIIPLPLYKQIEQNRNIPKDIKVDFAFIEGDPELRWELSNVFKLEGKVGLNKELVAKDLKENSFVASLQVGNFAIRITYYRDVKKLGVKMPLPESDNVLRISPYKKNPNFTGGGNYETLFSFHIESSLVKK